MSDNRYEICSLQNCNSLLTADKNMRFVFIIDKDITKHWRTEGGLGGSNPPPKLRNFDEIPKIKKMLLYEMKFVVPNYS
jgi:hypothetical protein